MYTNTKQNPYISVGGGSVNKDTNSTVFKPAQSTRKEVVYDPNSVEKKKLMNDLFGGKTTTEEEEKPKPKTTFTNPSTKTISKPSGGLFSNMTVKKTGNQESQASQPPQNTNINLLGFDDIKPTTITPPPQTTQGQTLELLNDIFGNTTTQPIQPQTVPSNNLFGNLTMTSNPIQSNPFTPIKMTTDEFGDNWSNYPEEDSFELPEAFKAPSDFQDLITSKAHFTGVDIQSNEAISCAQYKGKIVLVFATIETGHTPFMVKCQDKSLNNEIAQYLLGALH